MHLLISRKPIRFPHRGHGKPGVIAKFDTYGEAIAAYEAVDGFANDFAVRDDADPQWANLPDVPDMKFATVWQARNAAAKYRDQKVAETAKWVIATKGQSSFSWLVKIALETLAVEGLKPNKFDVHQAIKDRVLVGRCHDCDAAWWFPKNEGPLRSRGCHTCGASHLHQTTLSLRRRFNRLPSPQATTPA